MALLSSRGISTPSLQAQREQRRSSYFNNHRDIANKKADPTLESALAYYTSRENHDLLEGCSPS
jgi:hypothetical protein